MSDIILLVFEGEKTEVNIFNSLKNEFSTSESSTVLHATYNTSIYQLWKQLKDDPYLDIVEILRDRSEENKSTLEGIGRDDVSQVYLFFDYDGHTKNASDDAIENMLTHFNEETEYGKLYISYPMVEALKDLNDKDDYKDNIVLAKRNIRYKEKVGVSTKYQDVGRLNNDDWQYIIKENLCKGNLIVNDIYSMPNERLCQDVIFDNQLEKFILPDSKIAVLSAFPFFIVEYFGEGIVLSKKDD